MQGINSVNRALISKHPDDQSKNVLFVEGYGLKDVMGMEGVIGTETTTNHVRGLFSLFLIKP
jgi:DNA-directed RNA polymerase III subunit RPC1